MKIRPVGAQLFHVGMRVGGRTHAQTDRHDGDDNRFSQFCERT
jgi:hypothetical protein